MTKLHPMNISSFALYVACTADDTLSSFKIGRTYTDVKKQYSTRYHPQGYKFLRHWSGYKYYALEHKVHNHPLLLPYRIRCDTTGRLTEWFTAPLILIDTVVDILITENAANNTTPQQLVTVSLDPETNFWTFRILKTPEGLYEAYLICKNILDKNKSKAKTIERDDKIKSELDELQSFIVENYSPRDGSFVTSDELRKGFIMHCGITEKDVSPKKFGMLMSSYMKNNEINTYGIKRNLVNTGTVYSGIRPQVNKPSQTDLSSVRTKAQIAQLMPTVTPIQKPISIPMQPPY